MRAPKTCDACDNVMNVPFAVSGLDNQRFNFLERKLSFVAKAAREQCQFCTLIVKIFSTTSGNNQTQLLEKWWPYVTVHMKIDFGHGSGGFLFVQFKADRAGSRVFQSPWWNSNSYSLALRTSATGNWSHFPVFKPSAHGLNASVQQIKVWLDNCLTKHTRSLCSHLDYSPSRLIDVGRADGAIKLVDCFPTNTAYIALSYVWGMAPKHLTTTKNLRARKSNIAHTAFAQSHLEAIRLCRALGYQFIWIDSFCILQDDARDRVRELDSMAQIYSGAVLVISIAHASNAEEGCFIKRAALTTVKMPFSKISRGEPDEILVLPDPAPAHSVLATTTELTASSLLIRTAPPVWPAFTRGWCFQERLLAARVVHLGPDEMFWECRKTCACECGFLTKSPSGVKRMMDETVHCDDDGSLFWLRSTPWRFIMFQASASNLSLDEDKLPSLSGIARYLARPGLGKYLAGMWEFDLINTLAWHSLPGKPHRRPRRYVAPSWSWTSVVGQIELVCWIDQHSAEFNVTNAAQIIEAVCEPAGSNPYSYVKSGHLTLAGLTWNYKVIKHRESIHTHQISGNLVCKLLFFWDVQPAEIHEAEEVKFLVLWDMMRRTHNKHAEVLVLKPSPNNRGKWKRIGLMRIMSRFDEQGSRVWDDFLAIRGWYSSTWSRECLTIV